LIVSTKADWIAIDDNGKSIVYYANIRLNPEILERADY
jgi:hypothetical protein